MSPLLVPSRFCGPPSSGNGGWTAGALADLLTDTDASWPAVEVTLRRPPPLDVALPTSPDDGRLAATHDGAVVAEARLVDVGPTPVEGVDADRAVAASATYPGLVRHPFPTCFSCGPDRTDGLRIFPGQVEPGRVAAPWTPADDTATLACTWAALDCVGGWSCDLEDRPMVLGRMTAVVDALPVVGEPHVVVGEARRAEGRKVFTASTLRESAGRVVGRAEHVWFVVDPTAFG